MKLPALVTTIGFLLLLGGSFVQTFWPYVPQGELRGVLPPLPAVQPSVKNWTSGTLQTQIENWLERNVGFRTYAVRTQNQINFSLFDELSNNQGVIVDLGQDNWLYERNYIDSYLGRDLAPKAFHVQYAMDIKALQDELAKRKIGFLLLISPNKAAIYPEYLPVGMAPDIPPLTNHQQFMPIVQQANVNVFDTATRLRGEKAAHPEYLLFPRGGTHWDYYGAAILLEELMNRLAILANKPAVQFDLGPIVINREMQVTENDLGEVLNLWTPDDFISPLPHVSVKQKLAPPGSKLNLLWVGSSFNWTLLDLLTQTQGYEKCDFLYYDRTRYRFPPPSTYQSVQRMKFAERTDLLSRQAVVLEINEAALTADGPDVYGPRFVREALEYLRSTETEPAPSTVSAPHESRE